MVHGVRKGVARGVKCPVGKSMCFTSYDAAVAARIRLNAERVYPCNVCGYFHITRYTAGEYSQRMADSGDEGCTSEPEYGIVVSYTDEGDRDEGQEQAASDGRQPRGRGGDAGAASLERSGDPRLAPSPATLARFLKGRGDPRRELT